MVTSTKGTDVSIDNLMAVLDTYFKNKEFAPSLSTVKGRYLGMRLEIINCY